MPGYNLLEQKSLTPPRPNGQGVIANKSEIGFLDFLREIKQDEFPFNENSSLRIIGLEEYLLSVRPDMENEAKRLRQILQKAANSFFVKGCGDVQIVFKGELEFGQHLNVKHVTATIPIYHIFGFVTQVTINNQKIYKATFNLS